MCDAAVMWCFWKLKWLVFAGTKMVRREEAVSHGVENTKIKQLAGVVQGCARSSEA